MRYFTDNDAVWKWDGMEMWVRLANSGWARSLFRNPNDLMQSLNNIREIPEP